MSIRRAIDKTAKERSGDKLCREAESVKGANEERLGNGEIEQEK